MSADNNDLLTKVEAAAFLAGKPLPSSFEDRLRYFIEFYVCPNCDGVEDMAIVMRTWDEPSPCSFCVVDTAAWLADRGAGEPEPPTPSVVDITGEYFKLMVEEEVIKALNGAHYVRPDGTYQLVWEKV